MMCRLLIPAVQTGQGQKSLLFEKRSKKPLLFRMCGARRPHKPRSKSFLVLFFKKEHSFFLLKKGQGIGPWPAS
jgi:hypothetical protein